MRFFARLLPAVLATLFGVGALGAQQTDTLRRPPAAAPASRSASDIDSIKPPISPRRAFLYSMVAPGYAQTILGRHKAASAFMLVEGITLVMIRESAADVREARRLSTDSVIVSYADPAAGTQSVKLPPRFNPAYVHTRQAHVEDWLALLVANHLFAGADAFVAAHLWDVPARLGLRMFPGRTTLAVSMKW